MGELLRVQDLRVSFPSYNGEVRAVRGVSFSVYEGETLADAALNGEELAV